MQQGAPRGGERTMLGRDELTGRLERAIEEGRSLVLHGPAGVGKTVLARWLADRESSPPLWVQGAPGLAAVPLGALAPSLDRVADGAADVAAVATQLLGDGGDLRLCVVDDLQWVDDLSIGVVQQLATVHGVPVLATIRSDEALSVAAAAFQRSAGLETIDVEPLDEVGVAELVADLLGGSVDAGLVATVAESSAGNPLFASELTAGGVAAGAIVAVDGVWTLRGDLVPSRVLRDVVAARFAGLDASLVEAAELLAMADYLRLEHAEVCLGGDRLRLLERAGLLHFRSAGGRELVELDHPVYGEVLRSGIGPLGRRSYGRDLATSLVASLDGRDPDDVDGGPLTDDELVRLTRWRLLGGIPVAASTAGAVARIAHRRFDYDLAIDLAGRSFDEEPTASVGNLLAEALHVRGRHDEAHGVLARMLTLESDEHERATTVGITALTTLHGEADPDGARAMLAEALTTTTDPAARLALLTSDLYVVLMSADFGSLPEVLGALGAEFPPHATMASRQVVAGARLVQGDLEEAAALITTAPLRADDLFVRADDLENLTGGLEALALARAGRIDEADGVGRRSHRRCVALGDRRSQAMASVVLSLVALEQAAPDPAEGWARDATRALDEVLAPNIACAANAMLLLAAAERGDGPTIRAAIAELDRFIDGPDRLYVAFGERGRGVAMATDDPRAAVAHLRHVSDRYLAEGADEFAADLRYEALRFAPPTVEDREVLSAIAARRSGAMAGVRARHAAALLDGDLDALVAVVDDLLDLGMARTGRTAIGHAIALASTQGYERRARELRYRLDALARRSGSTPAGPDDDAPEHDGLWGLLTPRERDIATRAARGHPSKRIAADLSISRRTVDNTLQRVFAKLGVTSRSELIDLAPGEG